MEVGELGGREEEVLRRRRHGGGMIAFTVMNWSMMIMCLRVGRETIDIQEGGCFISCFDLPLKFFLF